MRKKYTKLVLICAALTLLPLIAGLALWSKLPEVIPSGIDTEGNVTSTNSREFTVIWMPLLMLLAHFLLTSVGSRKHADALTDKAYKAICCAAPLLCNAVCLPTLAAALGYNIPLNVVVCAIVGLMFIVLGIALPSLKPNYSIGLRFPWALRDDDVWVFTHKFAGIVFIICGIAMFVCGFFYSTLFAFSVFAAAVLIPLAVSGIYGSMIERRKQYAAAIKKAAERAAKNAKKKPQKPTKRLD